VIVTFFSSWRRFGFAELVLLEQDSVVIGAINYLVTQARIANPRQRQIVILEAPLFQERGWGEFFYTIFLYFILIGVVSATRFL
jgi:hypothetical protein